MVESFLLLTCLLLTPWLVQFARHVAKQPEAIPTPTLMVTSSVLFLFLFPLIGSYASGERFDSHGPSAVRIMMTTILYWATFTGTYLLASAGARTVQPNGPRGIPTSFGVLKQVAVSTPLATAMLVYVPLVLIKLFFIKSSGLGVSGGGLAMLTLPYHLVVLRLLTQTAGDAFAALFAIHLFGRSNILRKLAAAAGIGVELVFAVMAGRRPVLYVLVLVALGSVWSGKRRQALPLLLLGISLWFLVFVFSPIFLRARELWRSPNGPDVIAAFQIAIEGSSDNREKIEAESKENIKSRMNTYRFWLEFYDHVGQQTLGGKLLLQAVVMNIPRLFTGWTKYAYGATEEAIFGTSDIANNVCLESTLDLGPSGPLVYGIIFGLLFASMDGLVVWMSHRNKYIALMAIGGIFPLLLSPEADLMAYMGALRQIVIFVFLIPLTVTVFGRKPAVRTPLQQPEHLISNHSGMAA